MTRIEIEDIVYGLRQLIKPQDSTILIHSNIYAFGYLEQPVESMIKAILQCLGPDQTLLLPTFTFSFCKTGKYNAEETPSETGVLTEYFRKMPSVFRTRCPIYSFGVYGAKAHEFANLKLGESCWGAGSVFEALECQNALVIGLGEALSAIATIFHRGEELCRVPYRYYKNFSGEANFGSGSESISQKMFVRRLDLPTKHDFSPAINELKRQGKFLSIPIGMSFAEAFRTKDGLATFRAIVSNDSISMLAAREQYADLKNRKSVAFLGSSNLDITSCIFEDEYRANLGVSCRRVDLPFSQYRQEILREGSDLRAINPDYLIFLERVEDLLGPLLQEQKQEGDIRARVEHLLEAYTAVIRIARERFSGRFIVANFETVQPSPYGHCDGQLEFGFQHIIRIANEILARELNGMTDVVVFDFQSLTHRVGSQNVFSRKYWYMSRVPFNREFSVSISQSLTGLMASFEGRAARLLVLDLDNTLWQGVLGDDGIEGVQIGSDYPGNLYKAFQYFLKSLSTRGIALAISSKNDEKLALEMIREHPEMVLREKDFVDWQINWDDKASNITALCHSLNLGPQSVMFIDDNPAERALVRQLLPECIVPDMPDDVSEWIPFLSRSPFLQSHSVTGEDLKRVESYRHLKQATHQRKAFSNVDDYLFSLGMKIWIEPYQKNNAMRVLQLISKTNQFNTTTKRYSQGGLDKLVSESGALIFTLAFEDKFLERETIGLFILKPDEGDPQAIVISLFLMSCRVLGRNIETAAIAWMIRYSKKIGMKRLIGLYVASERNHLVSTLYARHRFKPLNHESYVFDLTQANLTTIPAYFDLSDSQINFASERVSYAE